MNRALVWFQLTTAGRAAQRAMIASFGIGLVLLGMAPDPAVLARRIAESVVAAGRPTGGLLILTLLVAAAARTALPLLLVGQRGWLRSLPASAAAHRRAILLSLVATALPILLFELAAVGAVPALYQSRLSGAKLVALPLLAWAAAAAVLPVRGAGGGRWSGLLSRVLALAAIGLGTRGTWAGDALALAALIGADRMAGAVAAGADRRPIEVSSPVGGSLLSSWRALGPRLTAPLVLGAVVMLFARLFRLNNDLSLAESGPATRSVAIVGLALALGMLGDGLLSHRPLWPWARSLPWSAAYRTRLDAAALAVPAGIGVLGPLALVDWRSALLTGLTLPLLALVASGAVRRGRGRTTGTLGELLLAAAIGSPLLGMIPGVALVSLLLVPVADWTAARAERNARPTEWDELRHHPDGDSLSWTGR
jgi:hypothetical protein